MAGSGGPAGGRPAASVRFPGGFALESGEVVRDCRIGYRAFGRLNADKSNAILFPTWFTGTSQQLADSIGPGKLADPARWYVLAVDALGNGVSSAPSNSRAPAAHAFPRALASGTWWNPSGGCWSAWASATCAR